MEEHDLKTGFEMDPDYLKNYHTICTCYMGRLCMTTHQSWELFMEFYNEHVKTCTQCQRQEANAKDTLERTGFNMSPGAGSTYTQLRGFVR